MNTLTSSPKRQSDISGIGIEGFSMKYAFWSGASQYRHLNTQDAREREAKNMYDISGEERIHEVCITLAGPNREKGRKIHNEINRLLGFSFFSNSDNE